MRSFLVLVLFYVQIAAICLSVTANIIVAAPARSALYLADTNKRSENQFKVYWNIPTFQCRPHGILFTDVYKSYGIIQNDDDSFRGNKFTILYDPGNFPALIEENGSGEYKRRNGGLPQEGSLDVHLDAFRKTLDKQMPDKNFNGIAVIDFESWRPIFRQNFGSLVPYKEESYKVERKKHPLWPNSWIQKEAAKRFEEAGRKFVEQTMQLAKELRPLARWGYYAFPYCFNMNPKTKVQECSKEIVKENNDAQWMWDVSDILLPSIYFNGNDLSSKERHQMVIGRTNEAKRIQGRTRGEKSIMLYFWFKYQDNDEKFLTKEDVYNTMEYMYKEGLEGVIIWGSSNDVNSKDKCIKLKEYVEAVLGPVIKQFTQNVKNVHKDFEYEDTTPDEEIGVLKNETSDRISVLGNEKHHDTSTPHSVNVNDINESKVKSAQTTKPYTTTDGFIQENIQDEIKKVSVENNNVVHIKDAVNLRHSDQPSVEMADGNVTDEEEDKPTEKTTLYMNTNKSNVTEILKDNSNKNIHKKIEIVQVKVAKNEDFHDLEESESTAMGTYVEKSEIDPTEDEKRGVDNETFDSISNQASSNNSEDRLKKYHDSQSILIRGRILGFKGPLYKILQRKR